MFVCHEAREVLLKIRGLRRPFITQSLGESILFEPAQKAKSLRRFKSSEAFTGFHFLQNRNGWVSKKDKPRVKIRQARCKSL
jgi:hypothetical protein